MNIKRDKARIDSGRAVFRVIVIVTLIFLSANITHAEILTNVSNVEMIGVFYTREAKQYVSTRNIRTSSLSSLVAEALRHLLAVRHEQSKETDSSAILRFYRGCRYLPLWVGDEGPTLRSKVLLKVLKEANQDGLSPQGYKISSLEYGLRTREPAALAKFDDLLTTALVRYARDLKHGRVRARDFEPDLFPELPPLDVIHFLKEATRAKDFYHFLTNLVPSVRGYRSLREALSRYRTLARAGGWPTIPAIGSEPVAILRSGMQDTRVAILRQRLRATGELRPEEEMVAPVLRGAPLPLSAISSKEDMTQSESDRKIVPTITRIALKGTTSTNPKHLVFISKKRKEPQQTIATYSITTDPKAREARIIPTRIISTVDNKEIFDWAVEEAVKRFQYRHGLEVDGVVGPQTLATLNVPIEARLRQIVLTMERWRWTPLNLEQRYVMVNIPAAILEVWDNGQAVLNMRVVVGQPRRQTPILRSFLTDLILNPLWNVPYKLAIEDVAKKACKDPAYITKQRIRIFITTVDNSSIELDPLDVDWHQVSKNRFPYRLRQDAGPKNAMGKIKFLMPNPDGVYLHDTPMRYIFQRASRAESSGCIRLEKAADLATYLLRQQNGWNQERINSIITEKKTKVVPFQRSIPIYLVYRTTWVDDNGTLQFRSDIYGRDNLLAKVLFNQP